MDSVAQRVNHYHESSLNHIKTISGPRFFIYFDYKMSTIILYVCIKYSMYDLIWDIISCYFLSCNTSKINV